MTSTPELRPAERPPVSIASYPDLRAYDVLVDGEVIGRVESTRSESWAKAGRIRVRHLGNPKSWRAELAHRPGDPWGDDRVGYEWQTRKEAVAALVKAAAERKAGR